MRSGTAYCFEWLSIYSTGKDVTAVLQNAHFYVQLLGGHGIGCEIQVKLEHVISQKSTHDVSSLVLCMAKKCAPVVGSKEFHFLWAVKYDKLAELQASTCK